MPVIKPRPLYRATRKHFAWLLGLAALPDACVEAIAWLIAVHKALIAEHKAGSKRLKGHTPARWAATLRRAGSRMSRGQVGPEAVREVTDPQFGVDVETFDQLAPIISDPDVPLERKLAVIEARRRELEALPEVDALYGLRVVLVELALVCVWYVFAVDRDETVRQWQFVLAILEAAGEGIEGVSQHPGRLKRDLGGMLQLTSQPAMPNVPLLSVTPP
jgi:hypothetical protein